MASIIMTSIEHEKLQQDKLNKSTTKEEKMEDGKSGNTTKQSK